MSAQRRQPLPEGPYLVVGLGRSGIAAAGALRRRDLQVAAVDQGSPEEAERLRQLGAQVELQSDGLQLLRGVGTLVKSPGVPEEAPVVQAARARGIEVIGELELAFRLLPNRIIAVTGTNGKTTTVHLIGEIFRQAQRPVAVAGNVGLALSALVDRIDSQVTVVCEASSFQLEDATTFAPDAFLLLNIAPDHLDRHRTYSAYVEAKLSAFSRLRPDDLALLPLDSDSVVTLPSSQGSLQERVRELGCRAPIVSFGFDAGADAAVIDGRICWHSEPIVEVSELRIRGSHNAANALAAAAVCLSVGIDVQAVRAGLLAFPGVEHRLEEVARIGEVLYVNDSKATNVASTVVALGAFGQASDLSQVGGGGVDGRGRPAAPGWAAQPADAAHSTRRIHLILGGQGKGQDFSALRRCVSECCASVHLIGEAQEEIAEALSQLHIDVHRCGDLASAVQSAGAAARRAAAARRWVAAARSAPGRSLQLSDQDVQVVLLSPAGASYDQFQSYEERGRRFKELVAEIVSSSR